MDDDNAAAAQDEDAGLQGERAGKEAYKGIQASSAAAIARQKAARTQVRTVAAIKSISPAVQCKYTPKYDDMLKLCHRCTMWL